MNYSNTDQIFLFDNTSTIDNKNININSSELKKTDNNHDLNIAIIPSKTKLLIKNIILEIDFLKKSINILSVSFIVFIITFIINYYFSCLKPTNYELTINKYSYDIYLRLLSVIIPVLFTLIIKIITFNGDKFLKQNKYLLSLYIIDIFSIIIFFFLFFYQTYSDDDQLSKLRSGISNGINFIKSQLKPKTINIFDNFKSKQMIISNDPKSNNASIFSSAVHQISQLFLNNNSNESIIYHNSLSNEFFNYFICFNLIYFLYNIGLINVIFWYKNKKLFDEKQSIIDINNINIKKTNGIINEINKKNIIILFLSIVVTGLMMDITCNLFLIIIIHIIDFTKNSFIKKINNSLDDLNDLLEAGDLPNYLTIRDIQTSILMFYIVILFIEIIDYLYLIYKNKNFIQFNKYLVLFFFKILLLIGINGSHILLKSKGMDLNYFINFNIFQLTLYLLINSIIVCNITHNNIQSLDINTMKIINNIIN